MLERYKIWFHNHKTWVYTLQYILYSIILVTVVSLIDIGVIPLADKIPSIFKTSLSLSKTILASLAGALLTITTFTFSTIMVVLNAYASNLTPRAVENFIKNKITMKVLGIFIGGFFYCVTALVFMRDVLEHEVISGIVAVIYSTICIIYFVIFVQKVVYNIQNVNIISEIYNQTLPVIEKEIEARVNSEQEIEGEENKPTILCSQESGYLSAIDYEKMQEVVGDSSALITIECKIGNYIVQGTPLMFLHNETDTWDEDCMEKLSKCFILQDSKVSFNDYRFGITKLVEIALRAISPGINDPNTAIHCIRKISILLSPLAAIDEYHISKIEENECMIYYTSYQLREDLYEIFYQIVSYGKEDISVVYALLEGMLAMMYGATKKNQKVINEFVDYIRYYTKDNFPHPMDESYLSAIYEKLAIEEVEELPLYE